MAREYRVKVKSWTWVLSGSWYSYKDSKLAQGRDATKAVIKDNPELADELEKLIFEALKEKK